MHSLANEDADLMAKRQQMLDLQEALGGLGLDIGQYSNAELRDLLFSAGQESRGEAGRLEQFAGQNAETSPMQAYKRLAGEVEARNTQARANLNDAERNATSPQSTADFAERDQIVMFAKGLAQMVSDKPTVAEITEAQRQLEEQLAIADRMIAERGGLFAPNGEKSELSRMQWAQVRTANFKRWFGDWEAAIGVERLADMKPLNLNDQEPVADKKGVEDAFRAFGPQENRNDGRTVTFPVSIAGKIERHRGFDAKRIAGALDRLFVDAVPMLSEAEQVKEGHKDHSTNIVAYHQYASRFEIDGKDYYVRFTIQQMRVKRGNPENNLAHSAFVSEVSIYGGSENGLALKQPASGLDTRAHSATNPLDAKLAQWLDAGNPATVSKVVDANGEPLVVYHGSRSTEALTEFVVSQSEPSDTRLKRTKDGAYFTRNPDKAAVYAGQDGSTYQVYLNHFT